jgi:SAM-dependent methyltransferase
MTTTADQISRNTDQEFYEEEPVGRDVIERHAVVMRDTSAHWLPKLRRWAGDRKLRILEIGSGSCVLAALIANEPFVESITCTDISSIRMQKALVSTLDVVPSQPGKIRNAEMDFNRPFPFADAGFDVVLCDAALHHARSMWFTLFEVNRVLKPDGVFIAQRETTLAPVTSSYVMRRLLTAPEFDAGVSENAYTMGQYRYYLKIAGFDLEVLRAEPNWKYKVLAFLNGVVFARFVLWAEKKAAPKYSA